MSPQIPAYLKLHAPQTAPRAPRRPRQNDAAQQFWRTFADATGWAVQPEREGARVRVRSTVTAGLMAGDGDDACVPLITIDAAERLAQAGADLVARLSAAEETIRRQAADLASGDVAPVAPVAPDKTHRKPLADTISAVLQEGAEATGCEAAALYLLDSTTSQLQIRAAFGLGADRMTAPARPLSDSLGDLEALSGAVVTLDDIGAVPQWTSPEPYAAAICVAVLVGETPVGTIWFWSPRQTEFQASQQAAARLTARLVGAELTRDTMNRRSESAKRLARPLRAAADWQRRQSPLDIVPATGWHVAGGTHWSDALSSVWYNWDVLPDGMMALAIAEAHGAGFDGAMIAATARSAWQAHAGYRHDPGQLLRRISDTLWQTNTGDQFVSMLYAQINPETGEGCCAAAGRISGIICGRYGFRPLVEQSQPLGMEIDVRPRLHHIQMMQGETLLAFNGALVGIGREGRMTGRMTQHRVAELARETMFEDLRGTIAAIQREAAKEKATTGDRVLLGLRRD